MYRVQFSQTTKDISKPPFIHSLHHCVSIHLSLDLLLRLGEKVTKHVKRLSGLLIIISHENNSMHMNELPVHLTIILSLQMLLIQIQFRKSHCVSLNYHIQHLLHVTEIFHSTHHLWKSTKLLNFVVTWITSCCHV